MYAREPPLIANSNSKLGQLQLVPSVSAVVVTISSPIMLKREKDGEGRRREEGSE